MKVSELFEDRPNGWGLRGDPYLWQELKERLSNTDMPASPKQLQAMIEQEYENATGYSIEHRHHFQIERFMHGGMSSGYISTEFWRNRAIPLLVSRHGQL